MVNWLYDCGEKTQPVVMGLVFCLLSYAKLDSFFISHAQIAKSDVFFLTSLHTRGELKVLGLTGERFPVLDEKSGFLQHLLAVWFPAELRARRIEAAQDFQGFLMWSCRLLFGMSHMDL